MFFMAACLQIAENLDWRLNAEFEDFYSFQAET
jgi:hypothetical protein